MAKRTTTSKTRTTLAATALLVLFAVVIPWGCEFDTTPVIHKGAPPKPVQEPVRRQDDNDSGESK